METAADAVFNTTRTTTPDVVKMAVDVAVDAGTEVEMATGDATLVLEVPAPQVVVEPGVAVAGAADSAETSLSEVVKTREAVSDVALPEASGSGEYASSGSSHAYAVAELVFAGLGANTEDLPPVPANVPAPIIRWAPLVRRRPLVPPRYEK